MTAERCGIIGRAVEPGFRGRGLAACAVGPCKVSWVTTDLRVWSGLHAQNLTFHTGGLGTWAGYRSKK